MNNAIESIGVIDDVLIGCGQGSFGANISLYIMCLATHLFKDGRLFY